jgi:hypothetical protein
LDGIRPLIRDGEAMVTVTENGLEANSMCSQSGRMESGRRVYRRLAERTIEKCRRRTGVALTVLTLVGGGLLFGPEAASAQDNCIQDVWQAHGNNQALTCTANDVTLSSASNVNITSGGDCDLVTGVCRCFAGQEVVFTADFRMTLTTQQRFDVGFYIATDPDLDNDGALTGTCSVTVSTDPNTANFINLDAAPDVCGDIDAAHNPLIVTSNEIRTQCPAEGQQVVVPFCTTWRQPGSNEVCLTANDAFPGSPSKCNCGDIAIPIFAAPVEFTVTKATVPEPTSVPESGGSVTYSVAVHNESTVADLTLNSLTDNQYGNITLVQGAVTFTECAVPQTIAPSGTYTCTFTATVPPGNSGGSFTDVVEACGQNVANPEVCHTDDATVTYTEVPQAPTLTKAATGAQCQIDVTYTVVVTNNPGQDPSPSPLTLTTLSDDKYGSITSAHPADPANNLGEVVSTTCAVPQTIAVSGNYTCSFVGRINSCDTILTDIVTGSGTAEGVTYPLSDSATVVVSPPSTPQ